jgi:ankyrin repeat protein
MTLSEEVEASLVRMDENPSTGVGELMVLLRDRLAQSEKLFIFIDALDEFEPRERRELLNLLASLGSSGPGLRVFLAGRESLREEINDKLSGIERLSMASAEAMTDVALYVQEALQDRIENRELVVGDQSLILDIKQALIEHADGMFLWVTFLIDELCAQHCDDDIRNAIGCLPKTLAETFSRALLRIVSRRNITVAAKTFSWVAIAKRPLTVDEIREAISIEIGQPYSIPERLVNNIDQLASWCENLIHVDEELKTVQFAHQTIYKFIIEGPSGPEVGKFCFNLPDADHHAGEICVTYLNFNDFKRTLARRSQPMTSVDPVAMAKLALSHQPKVSSAIPAFGLMSRSHKGKAEVDVVRVLSECKAGDGEQRSKSLEQSHPFLKYASIHWISHTSRFQKTSTTWGLWHQMITCGHDLAKVPWPEQQSFNVRAPDLLTWSLQSRHFALLRVIESCGGLSEPEVRWNTWDLAAQGDIELLNVLLEGNCALQPTTITLWYAAKGGRFEVVKRLLATAKVDVNVKDGQGMTPLLWAAKNGYEAIVKLLLATGKVDVDVKDNYGWTPLLVAAGNGYEAIVKLLLATGKVNADVKNKYGRTPLSWAAEKGYQAIVKLLLATGKVNVNVENSGRTPLSWAAEKGYEAIVKLLLATVTINVDARDDNGRTPLSWAAGNGHEAIVELLLAIGKVDIGVKDNDGRTPLSWAAENGYEAIVKLLLATGKVDIDVKGNNGHTPLSLAASRDHKAVVELLLATGKADVDVKGNNGHTPLSLAASRGHEAIVELLLAISQANVDMKDHYDGWSPLSWAANNGREAIVKLLLATGKVDINTEDNIGRTPLLLAANDGREAIVKLLLATGKVDINAGDNDGRTPLVLAARNAHEAVVMLLETAATK